MAADGFDAPQHADLEGVHRDVFEEASRLIRHPLGVQRLNTLDAARVLHRDRSHDRQRMAPHAREREDVGLQAGAARRIGRGERHHDGREIGFGVGGHGGTAGAAAAAVRQRRQRQEPRTFARPSVVLLESSRFYSNGSSAMKKYMCLICGWIYDEALGAPGRRDPAGDEMGRRAAELDVSRMRGAQGRLRARRVLKRHVARDS